MPAPGATAAAALTRSPDFDGDGAAGFNGGDMSGYMASAHPLSSVSQSLEGMFGSSGSNTSLTFEELCKRHIVCGEGMGCVWRCVCRCVDVSVCVSACGCVCAWASGCMRPCSYFEQIFFQVVGLGMLYRGMQSATVCGVLTGNALLLCVSFDLQDAFQRGAEQFAIETQLSRRVAEWQDKIEPKLVAEVSVQGWTIWSPRRYTGYPRPSFLVTVVANGYVFLVFSFPFLRIAGVTARVRHLQVRL